MFAAHVEKTWQAAASSVIMDKHRQAMRTLVGLAVSAAKESAVTGGASLTCLALAVNASDADLAQSDADWSFFEAHFKVYMRVAMHWGRTWFSTARSATPDTLLTGPESDEEVWTCVKDLGGTHMTVATVWYAFAVAAGAFTNKACEYRKNAAHRTALWWMASELLTFADTDVPGSVGMKVIKLPGIFTAGEVVGGADAAAVARQECIDMLKSMDVSHVSVMDDAMYADEGSDSDGTDSGAMGCLEARGF